MTTPYTRVGGGEIRSSEHTGLPSSGRNRGSVPFLEDGDIGDLLGVEVEEVASTPFPDDWIDQMYSRIMQGLPIQHAGPLGVKKQRIQQSAGECRVGRWYNLGETMSLVTGGLEDDVQCMIGRNGGNRYRAYLYYDQRYIDPKAVQTEEREMVAGIVIVDMENDRKPVYWGQVVFRFSYSETGVSDLAHGLGIKASLMTAKKQIAGMNGDIVPEERVYEQMRDLLMYVVPDAHKEEARLTEIQR